MSPELDAALCEKYPKLFTRRNLPMTQTSMCWGFQCGDGWYTLIDVLCSELQHQTDDDGAPQLEAQQVKEKYGELRFTVSVGGNEVQHALIDMARSLSLRTCEKCGAPGKLRTDGWYSTRCDTHGQDANT